MLSGDTNTAAQQRARRKRHVFPKMADWLFDHGLTRYENTFIHAGFRHTESLFLMKRGYGHSRDEAWAQTKIYGSFETPEA